MLEFFKKLWSAIRFSPPEYKIHNDRTVYIVHGGEPICTVIVEGAGLVEIPSHKPKALDNS